jgi:pimeloyl-ACP methyl ester carboxylesterase
LLNPGPYPLPGVDLETWLIRFDKNGVCSSPKTREALLEKLASKESRPIIFFSHGWNNDFADAVDLYRRFLSEFEKVVAAHPVTALPAVFVGVIWPSVWLPSNSGPQIAGAFEDPDETSADEAMTRELADVLPGGTDWPRLYALLEQKRLTRDEAQELAHLLMPALQPSDEGGPREAAVSENNIIKTLADMQRAEIGQSDDDDLDAIGVVGGAALGGPAPAGFFDFLDPRSALRLASLYAMKDRAGKVGAVGVASLLRSMLKQSNAPIHVVGHSFGCKVMLSAVAAEPAPSRKLKSMLLLQPAISYLSFADTVPGRAGPGGYRNVLERVEDPILSTYSASDFPLHTLYHLALLRQRDFGEVQIAAAVTTAGNPPNAYAALGGYGPRGASEYLIDPIPGLGENFHYPGEARLVGLDGSQQKRIESHGDIANPYTAWALRHQMML